MSFTLCSVEVVIGGVPVTPEAVGPAAASASPPASHATETATRYADRGIGLLVGLWLLVALPLAWGLWTTLKQAWVLFG